MIVFFEIVIQIADTEDCVFSYQYVGIDIEGEILTRLAAGSLVPGIHV
jgi:hypothetical protein